MRLSPSESATKYKIGTKKKGNDNNTWIVYETSNKIKRWKKITEKINGKKYFIHNNGSRPYMVIIAKNEAYIYNCKYDDNDRCKYDKLLKKYKFIKKYIGKHPENKYIGNSIVLQLSQKKYLYIGNMIYEFIVNDNICKYYSFVGNNDVPYPVLLGEKYVYFMLDKKMIDRNLFSKNTYWYNAYDLFYGVRETLKINNKISISKKYIKEPFSQYSQQFKFTKINKPLY